MIYIVHAHSPAMLLLSVDYWEKNPDCLFIQNTMHSVVNNNNIYSLFYSNVIQNST